jgi:hypothetical protein
MKNAFYFLVTITFLSRVSFGQNGILAVDIDHLKDRNLFAIELMLLKWKCNTFRPDTVSREVWEQSFYIDEQAKELIYKIRPKSEESGIKIWTVTHHIPLLQIDSVTQKMDDNIITFHTKPGQISTNQLGQSLSKSEKVNMCIFVQSVRNLHEQLQWRIKEYQLGQE